MNLVYKAYSGFRKLSWGDGKARLWQRGSFLDSLRQTMRTNSSFCDFGRVLAFLGAR
jgi:hypothetical protein